MGTVPVWAEFLIPFVLSVCGVVATVVVSHFKLLQYSTVFYNTVLTFTILYHKIDDSVKSPTSSFTSHYLGCFYISLIKKNWWHRFQKANSSSVSTGLYSIFSFFFSLLMSLPPPFFLCPRFLVFFIYPVFLFSFFFVFPL